MFKSIRSLVYLSFIIVGISLFLVMAMGVRQSQLSNRYSEITSLSERILFSYGTIREQITEALIGGDYVQIKSIIPDIEQLNNNVTLLYDNEVIPVQYKLTMAETINLSGLVIGLRKLDATEQKQKAGLLIQQEMRRIGENLIKVDRIITGQIRHSVINFQLSIIGIMGMLISCAGFVLIILHRKAVKPLLDLANQASSEAVAQQSFMCPPEAGSEIVTLVDSVNEMLADGMSARESQAQDNPPDTMLLSKTVNETTNGLNAVINYAELLLESDRPDLSSEQKEMLSKIVENGERIGAQWQNVSQHFHS